MTLARFTRMLAALCLGLLYFGLSATAWTSPALASGFLEQLHGKWRGKGTIYHKGSNPSKDPVACRIKTKYRTDKGTLSLDGRCGSVSLTSSFSSLLTEGDKGQVSGTPILQHGKFAKISLEGEAEETRLRLKGTDGINEVFISFFLLENGTFQTISGRNKGPKEVNEIVINWTKE